MKTTTQFSFLLITAAAVSASGGGGGAGAPTPNAGTQIVSLSNTPQPALMRSDSTYVLPMAPLAPGGSYTVQLPPGASSGVTFAKSFSFTTN